MTGGDAYRPALSAELTASVIVEPARRRRARKRQTYRPSHAPHSIADLLTAEDFARRLRQCAVFFQADCGCDDVMGEVVIRGGRRTAAYQYRAVDESTDTAQLLADVHASRKSVWILDFHTGRLSETLVRNVVGLAATGSRGMWIRGFARDFHPRDLAMFGATFASALSASEIELLRSVLRIEDDIVQDMRGSNGEGLELPHAVAAGDHHGPLGVIFVALNYARLPITAPRIATNPVLLSPLPVDTRRTHTDVAPSAHESFPALQSLRK